MLMKQRWLAHISLRARGRGTKTFPAIHHTHTHTDMRLGTLIRILSVSQMWQNVQFGCQLGV